METYPITETLQDHPITRPTLERLSSADPFGDPTPWYVIDVETGESEPVSWGNWQAYLIDLETDGLPQDIMLELYAFLLATGLVYHLQGNHARTVDILIDAGLL